MNARCMLIVFLRRVVSEMDKNGGCRNRHVCGGVQPRSIRRRVRDSRSRRVR